MLKRILQKSLVVILALAFLAGLCLLDGMSWCELLDNLTFLLMASWAYILLDDTIAKIIWYRYAITKEYLIDTGLNVLALAMFTASFLATSPTWGIVAFVLCIVAQAGGLGYWAYLRNKTDYTSFEIERMKWYVMIKSFRDMTREEIEDKVYSFLRYLPKRDYLENPLALSKPVDKTGKMRTVKGMVADADYDSPEVQESIQAVKELVNSYCTINNK